MNKQFYRIKFNAKLGTYVAVSELASSHQGDTSPRIKASINSNNDLAESNIATTGQRTLKQLVLALCSWMVISPIYANVVVNKSALAAQQPTVLKEGNTANVWITAPSASGVSRNSYTQFDVNKNGVILNNSRGAVTSQITKTSIAANPNLAKGAATTIVNEVSSSNPSLLQGNLEVLGSKANVVVANPTGITVNGGGFINANQVTLSTGVLDYHSDGSIKQHTVKQGAITINPNADNLGLGGNANNPVALELLGRSIAINAPVNATTITAITGANEISADTGESAVVGTGNVPTVAIDIAQLGGLYADSIYLYANEKGIGVNNAGIVKAKNNVVLNSNGKITNAATGLIQTTDATNGLMSIQNNLTDEHHDIVNTGKIKSANALFIDAGQDLHLQQDSYTGVSNTNSNSIVSLDAKGSVIGTGAMIKHYGSGQDIYINARNDISLTGEQGSGIQNNIGSHGGLYLNAGQNIKITDGLITSFNDLVMTSTNQLDLKDSSIYSRDAGIYINSVEKDIANAAINVTNTALDAKTKLAIQSAGLLNLTDLLLPVASGETSTRVQDVLFTAQNNLNLNQNNYILRAITGKLDIAAVGDISLATGLTGAKIEVKGLNGVNIQGANITTQNIKLSTDENLNITAQNDIKLQDNTGLWASSGDINISALEGNLTTTSLNALADKGKISLLADKDVTLDISKKNDVVKSGTALDQTNQKSKITAGQDINIGSMNQGALYITGTEIESTAGNINLIADKKINLYRDIDRKKIISSLGMVKYITTFLWTSLKAKDITVKSANSNVELWLQADATNDIVINAKGLNHIYGGELTSGRNIELYGGDKVKLWNINTNSGAHTAVSSDKNIYLNTDMDVEGQTSWEATSTVNMTAAGLLSLKSNGLQAHQRSNLKGGAINIEAGESLEWKNEYTLNAIDSAILKNNTALSEFNGDISIRTGAGNLSISPTDITLNAYGDIDLSVKDGDLTLVGIGGIEGNGSEQVVELNTTTGGISLEGNKVELQGSQLVAAKNINIVSSKDDIVIDGVKNTFSGKDIQKKILMHQRELVNLDNLIKDIEITQEYKDYAFKMKEADKSKSHTNIILVMALKSKIEKEYAELIGKLSEIKSIKDDLNKEIEIFKKLYNGYEHIGSNLTTSGDINLISSKGIIISGSDLNTNKGAVNIESSGTLLEKIYKIQGEYDSEIPTSVKQGEIRGSIIIDGLQDSYELGQLTDANYTWISPVNITNINADKGIKIRTTGKTSTDNIILQGAKIKSNNGDVNIEAYKNIIFDVAIENSYDKSQKTETKKTWYGKKKKTTTIKTTEESGGLYTDINAKNINIKSQEKNTDQMTGQNRTSIDMYSSQFTANGGKINIQAGGDLNFLTADDISLNTTDITKKSSFIGIKYNDSKTTATHNVVSELPAVLKADYIGTKSGFDTRLKGTEFEYLQEANIQAGGNITLEGASKTLTDTLKKESNSVVWQSMQDKGSINEIAKLPSFNGPIAPTFTATGGLTVQVPVVSGKNNDIRAEVIKLSNQPGNEYLKELITRKDVNWEAVKLAQENWNYKSQGLTGAGAALVVIIVTILTYGAGTSAAASVTAATNSAALGASAQAAVTTIASQASVSLINNSGDIGKTLKDLGSKESVKGLVTSVVTAGLLSEVGAALNIKPDSSVLSDRLIKNFTNSVGSTLVQTGINGGNLEDNLRVALLSGLAGTLQGELASQIGQSLDKIDPNILEYTIHKIAHAAVGCATASITKNCEAGAIGAAVGEIVAGLMIPEGKTALDLTDDERNNIKNTGKTIAGITAAYAGYDVTSAANSADTAIENNSLPRIVTSGGKIAKQVLDKIKAWPSNKPLQPSDIKKMFHDAGLQEIIDISDNIQTLINPTATWFDKISAAVDLAVGVDIKAGKNVAQSMKDKEVIQLKGGGPVHHICTDKNCESTLRGGPWTPKFQKYFEGAGLNIKNSVENLVAVPGHKGPHPQEYHTYIENSLATAVIGLKPNTIEYRNAVISTLGRIKMEAIMPGTQVNLWLLKK